MRKLPFNEVVSDVTSKFFKIKKANYLEDGKYLILDQGKRHIAGYTNDEKLTNNDFKPIIIFGDHTRIFKFESTPIALGADGAKALWVDSSVAYNKYVFAYLKSIKIKDAGYSRHFKFLKKIKIPIPFDGDQPNIDDQVRIAALLNRVEEIILTRKESLQQLDVFIKSTFLEIFGDPVNNEKGWEKKRIRDLVSDVKYGTSESAKGGKYKYLRMNNITYEGYWDFKKLKYIDIADKNVNKYTLQKNDLVFNRTNSKELVGKTAVYNEDEVVVIAGYLIRVRVNEKNNPWYIWGYLNSYYGKKRLQNLCRNIVGMANINAKELQAIPILRPPLELQNKFESIVKKICAIKNDYERNLLELEELYGSLSQKAFKGELDLSRVLLPAVEVNEQLDDVTSSKNDLENNLTQLTIPNEYPMSDPIGRKSLLQNIFNEYIEDRKGIAFSLEDYWQHVWFKVSDYMDEFSIPLGLNDYDDIKKWLFDLIKSGKIEQYFSEKDKQMVLKVKG